MEFIDPWWSTKDQPESFHSTFQEQLTKEISEGHPLYGVETFLIARGDGDDALFQIKDSEKVAFVHLTWGGKQSPPWPSTKIFSDINEWTKEVMIPQGS